MLSAKNAWAGFRNPGKPKKKQLVGHIYSPQFQGQLMPANGFDAATLQCRIVVAAWAAQAIPAQTQKEAVSLAGHHCTCSQQ